MGRLANSSAPAGGVDRVDRAGTSGSKASDWTTAGTTTDLLPDRFIVCAYDDKGNVTRSAGATSRTACRWDPITYRGDPATDPALAWMSDFTQAVTMGMGSPRAVDPSQAAKAGFARVLVLGVKSLARSIARRPRDWPPCSTRTTTRTGLELLPIGSPRTTATASKAGIPRTTPRTPTSYAIELRQPIRRRAPTVAGTATEWRGALGIDTVHFAHIGGAAGDTTTRRLP